MPNCLHRRDSHAESTVDDRSWTASLQTRSPLPLRRKSDRCCSVSAAPSLPEQNCCQTRSQPPADHLPASEAADDLTTNEASRSNHHPAQCRCASALGAIAPLQTTWSTSCSPLCPYELLYFHEVPVETTC